MNHKVIICIMLVLIFASCIGIGIYIYKINEISNTKTERIAEVSNQKITDECTKEGEEIVEANWTQKKVSPNATFIYKTTYKKCGHSFKKYDVAPQVAINKTKEEIEKMYDNWEIESFSNEEIVFKKQENGICKEHYVVRDEEGQIVIKTLDEDGNETILERTGIIVRYLPQNDRQDIEKGVFINGHEELNKYLENFE